MRTPIVNKLFIWLCCAITIYMLPSAGLGQTKSDGIDTTPINLRISFVGSSVTWGDGFLQSGLVKETILNTQKRRANVIGPADVQIKGQHTLMNTPNDRKFFEGKAIKITGLGSEISFSIPGDEISIIQGIDRTNINAAQIEVYIDDVLYDTFDNWNTSPLGKTHKAFRGDGETKKFDLGKAFTYNHAVTVASALKKGRHNAGGYGGGIVPDSDDYMIIRKYGQDSSNNPEVHHWLLFKTAPPKGAAIVSQFNYGEEISYEKTTIGKSGQGILESPFGDGDVSFDITKPTGVSSGLDFRETDHRALKTYRFALSKTRKIRLKIKGNCNGASGIPYFIFNFATNRFFYFQNAGIGGWKLSFLNDPNEFHRSYKKVIGFSPDLVMLETTPNDDWSVGGYKLYTQYKNISLPTLQSLRTLPVKSITYHDKTDNYDFQKWVGKIKRINERSVTILTDDTHGIDQLPVEGDYVFVGAYFSNNKEYAVRKISSYNAKTKEIFFDKPISTADFVYDDLQTLVGMEVRVRSFSVFEKELKQFISNIRNNHFATKISVISNPLPIIGARELWGYWEVIGKITDEKNVENLRISPFYNYQYSQLKDRSTTLNVSALKTDPMSGLKETDLEEPSGRNYQNFEVLVNGLNVYGKDAVVYNGYSYGIDPTKKGASLNMDYTKDGVRANQKTNAKTRLVFLKNAPTKGTIQIKYATKTWSGDGCHVQNDDDGSKIYGQIYFDFIRKM